MSLRIGDQVVGGSEKAGDPTADLQDRGGSPNADAGAHPVFPDAAGHHARWRWFYDCGSADCARGGLSRTGMAAVYQYQGKQAAPVEEAVELTR